MLGCTPRAARCWSHQGPRGERIAQKVLPFEHLQGDWHTCIFREIAVRTKKTNFWQRLTSGLVNIPAHHISMLRAVRTCKNALLFMRFLWIAAVLYWNQQLGWGSPGLYCSLAGWIQESSCKNATRWWTHCAISPSPPYQFSHGFQEALDKVRIWTLKDMSTLPSQNEGHFAPEQAESWN